MVKSLILFLFFSLSCVYADTYILEPQEHIEEKPSHEESLSLKIKQLLGENAFARHVKFLNIIFSDTSAFITNERVDVAKVISTLKDNGLLDLFFTKPQELHLTFQSSGYPLFFVKIMSDTLQSMGYYRFITDKAKQDESGFFWTIRLTSE